MYSIYTKVCFYIDLFFVYLEEDDNFVLLWLWTVVCWKISLQSNVKSTFDNGIFVVREHAVSWEEDEWEG